MMALQLRCRTKAGSKRLLTQKIQHMLGRYQYVVQSFMSHFDSSIQQNGCVVVHEDLDILDGVYPWGSEVLYTNELTVGDRGGFEGWFYKYFGKAPISIGKADGYILVAADIWDREENEGIWDEEEEEWLQDPEWGYQAELFFINTSNPNIIRVYSTDTDKITEVSIHSLGDTRIKDLVVCIALQLIKEGDTHDVTVTQ